MYIFSSDSKTMATAFVNYTCKSFIKLSPGLKVQYLLLEKPALRCLFHWLQCKYIPLFFHYWLQQQKDDFPLG